MRLGVHGRLRLAALKRAAREAGLAAGEAAVTGRDNRDEFGGRNLGGLGTLPATSMLRRSAIGGRRGEDLDWSEAYGGADVSES